MPLVKSSIRYLAEVLDIQTDTCTVRIDSLTLTNVFLRPVNDTSQTTFCITPVIESFVIVADLSMGRMQRMTVVSISEAQKIEINNPTQPSSNSPTQIEINGGTNGGLINIESLKSYLEALEQSITNALTTITNALATAGAPAPTIPTIFTNSMTQANQHLHTLEDPTITHQHPLPTPPSPITNPTITHYHPHHHPLPPTPPPITTPTITHYHPQSLKVHLV